jgi:hypothetical protein
MAGEKSNHFTDFLIIWVVVGAVFSFLFAVAVSGIFLAMWIARHLNGKVQQREVCAIGAGKSCVSVDYPPMIHERSCAAKGQDFGIVPVDDHIPAGQQADQ